MNALWDVGAYERFQNANPGWQIQEGFKEIYTGVEEIELLTSRGCPKVCPVIAKNAILFSNINAGSEIRIYNIAGRLLYDSGPITQDRYTFNTLMIPCGIYFYNLHSESNYVRYSGKFVIVK